MSLFESIMKPKNDNMNRLRERLVKMAPLLGIDPDDNEKMQIFFNTLKTQHNITKKNCIRYLKNKHQTCVSVKSFKELRDMSINTYVKLDHELDKYHRHQDKINKAYVRHNITAPLEFVHSEVGINKRIEVGGISVNIKSPRFEMFKNSTECVHCGIKGEFYAVERTAKSKAGVPPDWHLNCYGIKVLEGTKFEVLMTQDHIVPKSKGGINHVSNLQTMCEFCNQKKDSITDEVFKNGEQQEVTFKNINAVAIKYGIKLEQSDSGKLLWAADDTTPNLTIYQIEDRYIYDKCAIYELNWNSWMVEISNIAQKLRECGNGN